MDDIQVRFEDASNGQPGLVDVVVLGDSGEEYLRYENVSHLSRVVSTPEDAAAFLVQWFKLPGWMVDQLLYRCSTFSQEEAPQEVDEITVMLERMGAIRRCHGEGCVKAAEVALSSKPYCGACAERLVLDGEEHP